MKREKKRKEKEAKKLARSENKNSLDDNSMIAYVDEFGNVTDTPPDPAEREEINAEDVQAREMGMGGVPGFIVNRKYFLSGAQPATAFHKLFDLIIGDADAERRGGAQHDAY